MRPFNALYIAVFAASIAVLVVASLILRNKSEALRRRVIIIASLITLAGFFVYKGFLSVDRDFDRITAQMGGFNWWGELPLQLCNINMMLIPVAVLRRDRVLMSFGFFLAPLGAMMALAMPGNGFDGYSLLLPRMLGFYGTHFMIVIEGLAIVCFGLYRPRFRDLPRTALSALAISFIVFLVDLLLRASGLHPKANYFFAVETEGNFLLEIFHRWIPVPFLYLLPSIVILGVYMTVITGAFALADLLRGRRQTVNCR